MKIKIIDLCKKRLKLSCRNESSLNYSLTREFYLDFFYRGKIKKDIKCLYVISGTFIPHKSKGSAIVHQDGSEIYMHFGKLHRTNGEAITGTFKNIVSIDAQKQYWLYGSRFSEIEYLKILGKESLSHYL